MASLRFGLTGKLVASIMLLCGLTVGGLGWLTYVDSRDRLVEEARTSLERTAESRLNEIGDWSRAIDSELSFQSQAPYVRAALAAFTSGMTGRGDGYVGSVTTYDSADRTYRPYFEEFSKRRGFTDLYLFDAAGRLAFSIQHAELVGQMVGGLEDELAEIADKALKLGGRDSVLSDFHEHDGHTAAFAATVMRDQSGDLTGIIVAEIGVAQIAEFLLRSNREGKDRNSYLIGADGGIRIGNVAPSAPDQFDRDDPRLDALHGDRGTFVSSGDNPKVVTYAPLRVMGQSFGLITEKPHAELVKAAQQFGLATLVRGAVACLIAGIVVFIIARVLVRQFGQMTLALERLRDGRLDQAVEGTDKRDELGKTARAIEKLRLRLIDNREMEMDNRQKSAAVATSSAALMMTDSDFTIRYMNDALVRLMTDRDADFKSVAPDFSATELIGVNMDRFHKVPEQVRRLLTDPSNFPFNTDIRVGDAAIRLHVDPILDEDGQMNGLVLEWVDVTDRRRDQATLAAIDGSQAKAEFALDGVVLRGNDLFREWCGEGAQEGKAFVDHLHDLSNEPVGQKVFDAVRGGETVAGRYRIMLGDEPVILDGGFYPIRDIRNHTSSVVFIASNVTAEHKAKAESDAALHQLMEEQGKVVDALGVGLKAIASGDLTRRVKTPFAGGHDQLRQNFNQSTEHLSDAVRSVVLETSTMRQETAEIVRAADDLAKRTEKQAMTLQETASSLDELTQNVATTAEGTARANQLVAVAKNSAESSGQVVDSAERAMAEIDASSKEVVKVISVIDDIAFQTNLLALNAGVEAARAGEAGRGFAVVATEVRALAQRCSDAAAEIGQLISRSGQHVSHGVELVGQTGGALNEIVGSISEIATFVDEIARAGDEQSRALAQINGAVNQIDHATQQNAAMFEQTSSAAHGLAQRVSSLAEAIGKFKVDMAPVSPAAAVAMQPENRTPPPVEVSFAVANGGKAKVKTAVNDWREF